MAISLYDMYGRNIGVNNYSSALRKIGPRWNEPRVLNDIPGNDNFRNLGPYERSVYNSLARDLFRSCPAIRSAITRKNAWACATGWNPYFTGEDSEYGKILIDYISNDVLTDCNAAGTNYSFNRTLQALSNELDVGGDSLVVFTLCRDGKLKMLLYPSFVVGQRDISEIVIKGRYQGNLIYDGVVTDSNNAPIAYSVLQRNSDDDYYISARNAILCFEPEEAQMLRGISIIASALLSAIDIDEAVQSLNRTIKLSSKYGIKIKTPSAKQFTDGYMIGTNSDTGETKVREKPVVRDLGDYIFLDPRDSEELEAFKPEQPGDRVPEWLANLEEKVLYSIGWHSALISPSKIGSYASRIMESQVQQVIEARQTTLKRVATTYCLACIAKSIDDGTLPMPKNESDWRAVNFHMPPTFQIDSYYGAQTALQQWTTGNNSLANITARQGLNWIDVRKQREIEARDALTRAASLSKDFGISVERALDLISKQTQNASPVQQMPIEINQ